MELFHASKDLLSVGQVIKSNRANSFYVSASQQIDAKKPSQAPSRLQALYCSDQKEFAVFFLTYQGVTVDQINLYSVSVTGYHKAPFAITHQVESRLNKGVAVDQLVDEYWYPKRNWNYFEYLTLEFEVRDIISTPTLNEIALRTRYDRDFDLACQIS